MGVVGLGLIWRGRNSGFGRLREIGEVRDQLSGPISAAMAQPANAPPANPSNSARNAPDFDVWKHATPPAYNPFLDLLSYARLVGTKKKLGIFTIGGGVPRNWAQQVAPFYDIVQHRLGVEMDHPRFQYGVRICPEPVHWGGLSGCTYSEGVSWGKFIPQSEGGRFAEVYADATVAWPLIVRAVLERLGKIPPKK